MKLKFKFIGGSVGLLLFMPFNLFVAVIVLLSTAFATVAPVRINKSLFLFLAFMFFSILSISFGIAMGNSEAMQYLMRTVVCGFLLFVLSLFARRGDQEFLEAFLYCLTILALLNAFIVIITALVPAVYDLMRLRDLSGFDKATRQFRSPGLFRGFDTSGVFMVFGLISLQAVRWSERHGAFFKLLCTLLLITACALSSRTTIVLSALILCLSALMFRKSLGGVDRILFLFASTVLATAGLAFINLLLGDGAVFWYFSSVLEFEPSEIQYVYAVSGGDYVRQLNFSEIPFFPERNERVFDNFFARAGVQTGWVGVFGMGLPIAVSFLGCMLCYRGDMRVFTLLFFIAFTASNFKNNYFYFAPFFTIMAILYLCRPERSFPVVGVR